MWWINWLNKKKNDGKFVKTKSCHIIQVNKTIIVQNKTNVNMEMFAPKLKTDHGRRPRL